MEGKQPSANYQTMARLENLIHQGKNYDFSEAEMKQPLIVFNKLKERIDPVCLCIDCRKSKNRQHFAVFNLHTKQLIRKKLFAFLV